MRWAVLLLALFCAGRASADITLERHRSSNSSGVSNLEWDVGVPARDMAKLVRH